jgi:nitroreductase
MNETIERQLSHRSIRAFSDRTVPGETIDSLLAVANRTATSAGMQQFSIIHMADAEAKQRISQICGQAHIGQFPEIFIFVADCYRNYRIAREQGLDGERVRSADFFFQAFIDTCLAAQNVTTAIESIGMGATFFSILKNSRELIDALALPEFTLPTLGLGFGYPATDSPPEPLKPRMDVSLKVFRNRYAVFDDYLERIAGYDEEMRAYYDARGKGKSSASFSALVAKKTGNAREKHDPIPEVMKQQGFGWNSKE